MKDITLIFVGTGYKDMYQAKIEIYDMHNKLIYKGYTYNGYINVCLKKCCYYKIKAKVNNEILLGVIYTNKNIYKFVFNRSYIYHTITTFILTDYNYDNLPIEKGELILWKK